MTTLRLSLFATGLVATIAACNGGSSGGSYSTGGGGFSGSTGPGSKATSPSPSPAPSPKPSSSPIVITSPSPQPTGSPTATASPSPASSPSPSASPSPSTSPSTTTPARFLYVANQSVNGTPGYQILGFTIDAASGQLTPLATSVPGSGGTLRLHPNGKLLYEASQNITVFSIDATTGALTQASQITLGTTSVANAHDVKFVPSGKLAYICEGATNLIYGYSVDATTGALTTLSGFPITASAVSEITIDPSGSRLYAVSVTNATLVTYTIDATTGALTQVGSLSDGLGPTSLTVVGSFAFAGNEQGGTGGTVATPATALTGYSIGAQGLANNPAASGGYTSAWNRTFALHPTGKYLYGCGGAPQGQIFAGIQPVPNISVFSVDATNGTLTAGTFVATDPIGVSIEVERSGKFLYVLNQDGGPGFVGSISIFSIDATGKLTAVGAPYTPGGSSALQWPASLVTVP